MPLTPRRWRRNRAAKDTSTREPIETVNSRLAAAPLWDDAWYAEVSGCRPDRKATVRHYLRKGQRRGLSPHPLFDPGFVRAQLGKATAQEDPFLLYLDAVEGGSLVDPSPLFDTQHYLAQEPEALGYAGGPLAHYLAVGAPAGSSPNAWFRPRDRAPNLTDWAKQRHAEWATRQDAVPRRSRSAPAEAAPDQSRRPDPTQVPLVTVVLDMTGDPRLVDLAARSVRNQDYPNLEILALVVDGEAELPTALRGFTTTGVTVRPIARGEGAHELDHALRLASGEYISWLRAGQQWHRWHLSRAVLALGSGGTATLSVEQTIGKDLFDGALGLGPTGSARFATQEATAARLGAGLVPSLGAIVVRRSAAVAVGGFDTDLPAAQAHDFVYRLARTAPLRLIADVGLISLAQSQRDSPENDADAPALDHRRVPGWHEAVIARHHLDWSALERRDVDQHGITVVIQAREGWQATQHVLERVVETSPATGHAVSILVIACGRGAHDSLVLDSFAERFPGTRVAHYPADHTATLAFTLALEHIHTALVVTLDHRCEPDQGWIEPLITALQDSAVLAAQPLIVNASRSIQSAGYAFPSSGSLPYRFLDGFPTEDASAVGGLSFAALDDGALALRFIDLVRLRGFDPIFATGSAGVDLCLRATELTGGRLTVRPDSVVIRDADRAAFSWPASDRLLFLNRWASSWPQGDDQFWRSTGFRVLAHVPADQPEDRRLISRVPVIGRDRVTDVQEHPALRWAIKNPATADRTTHLWGDTNFANHLAIALRRLGQEVVIDLRPEFERASGDLDDVVVVLRGLVRHRPTLGQINLLWVMSHPERVTRAELESFDHVFAAGPAWAARMSSRWNLPITPLLQATDPHIFNPDRALPDSGHQILFVGNARATPRPVVMGAIEQGLPVSVYGSGWPAWIPEHHVCATELPNNDLGAAYRSASVVLNDHWDGPRREGFVCNRLFDAVAAGARVISDRVEGIEELFGRSVRVAETPGELAELVCQTDYDEVFGTEEERLLVSERVRTLHSFDSRAQTLLDTALRYRHRIADR